MSSSSLPLNFVTGQVGPQTLSDGAGARERMSKDNSLVVQDSHARYVESSYRGNTFQVCNSAAQALSLTGTTTYTGLVVYNTPASGKYLSLLTAAFAATTAVTGVGAVILFYQAPAATVPTLTATNAANGALTGILNGSKSSIAQVASSCTLAANPLFLRPLIGISWITGGTSHTQISAKDEIAGEILIPPGGAVGIVAVTTAISGVGSLSWEEIPV